LEQIILPLLPVVGGYRFACEWRASIYLVAYENDQRIYMRAVFYGAVLFLVAAGLWLFGRQTIEVVGALRRGAYDDVDFGVDHVLMSTNEFLAVAVAVMLTSKYLARALNRFGPLQNYYAKELENQIKNNEFAYLLYRAIPSVAPVMISLKNGKVYVGVVTSSVSNLESREYIGIIPMYSGFRNDRHEVEFTTDYSGAIKTLMNRDGDANGLVKVLPVSEIVSSNLFDFKAFAKFKAAKINP